MYPLEHNLESGLSERLSRRSFLRGIFLGGVALAAAGAADLWVESGARLPPLRERVMFGAFVPGIPNLARPLDELESALGRRVGIVSWYCDWQTIPGDGAEQQLSLDGRRPLLVAWEPNGITGEAVLAGTHDAYLKQFASWARTFGAPLFLRPWPEMNASWSSWQPTTSRATLMNGPAQFIAAWRHVFTLFRESGATNVHFVFNPDVTDTASDTAVTACWPGEAYVDVLGLDGFNWGGREWTGFVEIFEGMYGQLTELHPTAPVWVCECGCPDIATSPSGPSKAQWLGDMLNFRGFPRLTAISWFNADKERDWRLESSADSLRVARRLLPEARLGPAVVSRVAK